MDGLDNRCTHPTSPWVPHFSFSLLLGLFSPKMPWETKKCRKTNLYVIVYSCCWFGYTNISITWEKFTRNWFSSFRRVGGRRGGSNICTLHFNIVWCSVLWINKCSGCIFLSAELLVLTFIMLRRHPNFPSSFYSSHKISYNNEFPFYITCS